MQMAADRPIEARENRFGMVTLGCWPVLPRAKGDPRTGGTTSQPLEKAAPPGGSDGVPGMLPGSWPAIGLGIL
ncbi:hypothetical protein LBMAG53_02710 [Planctomycetota bacterium]|nr:hypothetical protein LBMAG53_02710 [Planctomycetota bacterium]